MEPSGLKNRKKFLKRQDAIDDIEETVADDNHFEQKVLAHFKEKRADLDQSVFEYIKDFCKRKFLAADKVASPALDDEMVSSAIGEITEIINKDKDGKVKDLKEDKEAEPPVDGAAAKFKKLHVD